MMCTHMAAFIGTPFRVQKLKDPLQNVAYVLVWQDGETWRCFGGRGLNLTYALAV